MMTNADAESKKVHSEWQYNTDALHSYEVNIAVSDLSAAGSYSCYTTHQGYQIYNITGQLDVYGGF